MRTQFNRIALATIGSLFLLTACSRSEEQSVAANLSPTNAPADAAEAEAEPVKEPVKLEPVELSEFQDELLEICYEAATKFPLNPHIKNRSRAQAQVVDATFELADPERALRYTMGIEDWRRGACYADYAYQMALRGDSDRAHEFVGKAEQFLEEEADWRGYRILAKIARTHQRLGNTELAAEVAGQIENGTELAAYETERARDREEVELADQLAWAEQTAKGGSLEEMDLVFQTLTVVYERVYADEEARAAIEEALQGIRSNAPLELTLRTLEDLTRIAIANGDLDHARELSTETDDLFGSVDWSSESEIQVGSKVAEMRYLAGEEEGALEELARLKRLYDISLPRIFDVFRADALVPLAEAYAAISETDKAYETYALALEESTKNPNSRPRVDDLILISLSMIHQGLEPTPEMMERIREINEGLGDPW